MKQNKINNNSKTLCLFFLERLYTTSPTGIYMPKVKNRNNSSKLIVKTPEKHKLCHFGVFIVNLKQISYIVLPLLTFKKQMLAGRQKSMLSMNGSLQTFFHSIPCTQCHFELFLFFSHSREQGFPNSVMGWGVYPAEGESEISLGGIFLQGGGNMRRSEFDHSNLS